MSPERVSAGGEGEGHSLKRDRRQKNNIRTLLSVYIITDLIIIKVSTEPHRSLPRAGSTLYNNSRKTTMTTKHAMASTNSTIGINNDHKARDGIH